MKILLVSEQHPDPNRIMIRIQPEPDSNQMRIRIPINTVFPLKRGHKEGINETLDPEIGLDLNRIRDFIAVRALDPDPNIGEEKNRS